jgi:hypothetical protein
LRARWHRACAGKGQVVLLSGEPDVELLPPSLRKGAIAIIAAMYHLMGLVPSVKNFRYHKEDPRTRHKRCPGVNVGSKDQWIADVKKRLATTRTSDDE